MSYQIIWLSMKRHIKATGTWLGTLVMLIGLGLAFYPAISENMQSISVLFESSMMKNMLSLFASGPDQLTTLPGFYSTYASIYVILISAFYGMLSGLGEVAGELRDKTMEFLLTRPITRRKLLFSKWISVQIRIVFMVIVLLLSTLVCFQILSRNAPMQFYDDARAVKSIEESVLSRPENIQQVWSMDEDFLQGWLMSTVQIAMDASEQSIREISLSEQDAAMLIRELMEDSEGFEASILENPERILSVAGLSEEEIEALRPQIQKQIEVFNKLRSTFKDDVGVQAMMFEANSTYFFKQIKNANNRTNFIKAYPESEKEIGCIIKTYSTKRLVIFHVYIGFLMSVFSTSAFLISLILKDVRSANNVGLGIVLVLYFLNTILRLAPSLNGVRQLTLFGLVRQDLTESLYAGHGDAFVVFIVLILILFIGAFVVFEKKDIAA